MQVVTRIVFKDICSEYTSIIFYFLVFSFMGFLMVPFYISMHTILEAKFFLKLCKESIVPTNFLIISINMIS